MGLYQPIEMFDPQKAAQTVFDLAKDYTAATIQVMTTSMEIYEQTLAALQKQGAVAQQESQKLLTDWMNRAKQGQQQYWNLMEENLKKLETYFNPDSQKRASK